MIKTPSEIRQTAVKTILQEAEAINLLSGYINDDFIKVVELIFLGKGRVILTGIGKSANIASKIVATLNSTGTPAVFMHAADAIHGDLGIVQQHDIVICLSKSGNTPEIKVLVPLIKRNRNILVAFVGNRESFLAKNADYIIETTVPHEACPNNLAPTSSTTAQLVMGDALAVCLLEMRGFSSDDFAKYHPGGTLGKKLYMTVGDLFINNPVPKVSFDETIENTIVEISSKRLGATAVIGPDEKLAGIITDGDIRRMLQKKLPIDQLKASDIMSVNPKTIDRDELAVKAFNLMEDNNITQLIVTQNGQYCGILHLHDILKEGII